MWDLNNSHTHLRARRHRMCLCLYLGQAWPGVRLQLAEGERNLGSAELTWDVCAHCHGRHMSLSPYVERVWLVGGAQQAVGLLALL